jgi:hypothetical protein
MSSKCDRSHDLEPQVVPGLEAIIWIYQFSINFLAKGIGKKRNGRSGRAGGNRMESYLGCNGATRVM